jgi:hypothetical protein
MADIASTTELIAEETQAYRRKADDAAKMREYRKKWIALNPEKHAAAVEKHRRENKERILKRSAEWKRNNREKIRAYERERYARDPEKRAEKRRLQRRKDPEKDREIRLRSQRKRCQRPQVRLENSVRAGVVASLVKGAKAGRKTFDLLGYTLEQLMAHLEAQFRDGMNWSNYGEWHIDHVRPLCRFEYQSPDDEQFRAAWCLENLQPLWARDNLRKGGRFRD